LIVELDGTGNVIEIDDVIGVGSGGLFAECAAKALLDHTNLGAE
jgi:ATP-dependent protease HslVU (ClpYQ) peptidase subunit